MEFCYIESHNPGIMEFLTVFPRIFYPYFNKKRVFLITWIYNNRYKLIPFEIHWDTFYLSSYLQFPFIPITSLSNQIELFKLPLVTSGCPFFPFCCSIIMIRSESCASSVKGHAHAATRNVNGTQR